MLLQDLLALQAVGALRGRASGEGRPSSGGHPMPGGVSPEGCLVLAGRPLAVDLVLHHGYAVQLRAAPATHMAGNRGEGWWLSDTERKDFTQVTLKGVKSCGFGEQILIRAAAN